ncbi:MAG: hypothetical protein DMF72_17700 [Acidobacteria bacterium]|nr:MAG: hypothetical protein DMF72_17700 [Acidobacteriota bacterium]
MLSAIAAFAQANKPDRLVEEKKERDATVGVVSYHDRESNGIKSATFYLVDLGLRDVETNTPFLYVIDVDGRGEDYPLKPERTYKAHMRDGKVISILIGGTNVPMKEWGFSGTSQTWTCESRPSPEGGHWERKPDGDFHCAPGTKESVKWKADKGSKQETGRSNQKSNIPPCDLLQQPFHDTALTVVITVKPASGLQWTFPEAPSHVAQRILADLNANQRNITFKEASGVVPNLYINVTVSEISEGTKQDTANAEVTGLGKAGTLFSASSGQAPFVGLAEAIDHLSTNMLTWFEGGWHRPGPCVAPNGEILP